MKQFLLIRCDITVGILLKRLCYSFWLFHLYSAVKIQLFFQFSPWREPRLRHFAGYPFGASRKKASTIFYNSH